MPLIYQRTVKRVVFECGDSQRLAELREALQKKSTKRLSDSETIRKAITLALGLVSNGGAP